MTQDEYVARALHDRVWRGHDGRSGRNACIWEHQPPQIKAHYLWMAQAALKAAKMHGELIGA